MNIILENLCNLFFELSNEDRLRIFLQLNGKALRMTQLSRMLTLTVQETSRHLSRLSEMKLVKKDVEGFYSYTPVGEQVLRLIPGFEVISKHVEHFNTHNYSFLPHTFTSRIGDLVNCTLTDDVMVGFHRVENRILEAEEYVWILSDQILMSSIDPLKKAINCGAQFKIILPIRMNPPAGFIDHDDEKFFEEATVSKFMERRFLEKIELSMVLSEKEAGVVFPTLDGRLDYGFGFLTTDKLGYDWCKDLFLYYWEKATIEIPEYLR